MVLIEILAAAREVPFVDKQTGEARSFRVQEAALFAPGQKYPKLFDYSVPRNSSPLAPGKYQLAPESIYVNRMGKLSITPKLVPVAAAAKVG